MNLPSNNSNTRITFTTVMPRFDFRMDIKVRAAIKKMIVVSPTHKAAVAVLQTFPTEKNVSENKHYY